MTELDLFYRCVPDIAEITVDLRKKTPEQQERFKSECLEYAAGLGRFAHDFICKVLIVIDKYLKGNEDTETVEIDDIKIYPCFAANPPKLGRVERKEWQYAEFGLAEADIVLDSSNHLIDGYIWYLLAKSYGLTHVPVRYGRRQIITAAHRTGGKLYRWELPGILVGRVHPGEKVKVQTCRGIRTVRVAGVEEYAGEPEPFRMVIRKYQRAAGTGHQEDIKAGQGGNGL